ncbi:Ig-like domain-containing protein [bacterium]|nr:Ig-like domain-containing protein [bacterium]
MRPPIRQLRHLGLGLLLLLAMSACGGGGGGNPQPPDKLTLTVEVEQPGGSAGAGVAVLLGLSLKFTNAQGVAQFTDLTAGSYSISAQLPDGTFVSENFTLSSQAQSLQLMPGSVPAAAVSAVTPFMGSAAELDATIRLATDTLLDADSLDEEDFSVTPDIGPLRLELSDGGTDILITPLLQLSPAQTYVFDYSGVISSSAGAPLLKPLHFLLRSAATDQAAPRLLSTTPGEGASAFPVNRPVVFSYNELLDPDSAVQVSASPEAELETVISGRNLSIRAIGNWALQTDYSLSVTGLSDLAGNLRGASDSLSFRTGSEAAPVTNQQPDWNRVTDSIVFSSDQAGSFDIWAIDSDGANLRQLTFDAGDETSPSLSSDGALLCWQARGAAGDQDIFVADVSDGDASDGQAVTGGPFNDRQPVFSRTFSRSIFFVSERSNPASVYSIDSAGGSLTALDFNFASGQADPAPHPLLDTQLLFTSGRSGSNDVWRMLRSVIDNEVIDTNLTDDLLAQDSQPDWLADASGYVYISNRSGVDNLWLGDFSGGLERQVSNFELNASSPSVSPFTGEALCALSLASPEGGRNIVIIELVGGSIVSNLTGGGA